MSSSRTQAAVAPVIAAAEADPARAYLRWLADTYERVQVIRLEAGERIRAVAQGRIASAGSAEDAMQHTPAHAPCADTGSPDGLLAAIRAGRLDGPVPVLGQTYRVHWAEERRLRAAMATALAAHPAWPWLQAVRGIGPTLSARLLSRLDIKRAPFPSSFWSYCGLGTVPAVQYWCPVCGKTRIVAESARIPWRHLSGPDAAECSGRLLRRPQPGLRVAPPGPLRGERPSFDRMARRTCYQAGVSLLRARGTYADFYHRHRAAIEQSDRAWTPAHCHMAGLRKMVKLFLSHLWIVWAGDTQVATPRPYAQHVLGRAGIIDPWSMAVPRRITR